MGDSACQWPEAFLCVPIVNRNRAEWADRHYLLPGYHYATSVNGIIQGFELSYFRSIGLGGLGALATIDKTPGGQRVGLGAEFFLTYFGFDVTIQNSTFEYSEKSETQLRWMASVGWISLYYRPGEQRQFGTIVKLPIKFDK
jgi:hypothetical protein